MKEQYLMTESEYIWLQAHCIACKAMEEEYEEMEAKRIEHLHVNGIFDDVIDDEERIELEMEYASLHTELIEFGLSHGRGYNPFAS